MACCAFAVILLLHLLAPLQGLRRRLFGEPQRHNAAVAWRPGHAATAVPAATGRPRRWPWLLGLLVVFELALAGTWLAGPTDDTRAAASYRWDAMALAPDAWCHASRD